MNDTPSTDLAKSQVSSGGALAALAPQNIDDAFRLAKALSMAGDMVPKHFQGKPEMTMAAIVRGMEIGLAPMQALSNIAVINGRASVWGDALPALMQRAGHHIDVEMVGEGEKSKAVATLTRGDTGKTIVREFSVEDAKRANLWGKQGPWQQYPRRMLSHRARAWAVRDGAADALMGLQIAEETSDYQPMKDVTPQPGGFVAKAQAARAPETPQEADPAHDAPDAPDAEGMPPDGEHSGSLTINDLDLSEAFPGSDEFTEGVKAFKANQFIADCPHSDDRQKATDWCGGWTQASKAEEPSGERGESST